MCNWQTSHDRKLSVKGGSLNMIIRRKLFLADNYVWGKSRAKLGKTTRIAGIPFRVQLFNLFNHLLRNGISPQRGIIIFMYFGPN